MLSKWKYSYLGDYKITSATRACGRDFTIAVEMQTYLKTRLIYLETRMKVWTLSTVQTDKDELLGLHINNNSKSGG